MASKLLADAAVDMIAFACTSGSLVNGVGYDKAIAKKITNVAGCPAVTTSSAVVDALKTVKTQKIALATPYIEEVAEKEIEFLTKSGFEVVKHKSLGIKENLKIGKLTANDAKNLAEQADAPDAQAVFISCTNFQTFKVLSLIEEQVGKPVISSNSATLWMSLKTLNLKMPTDLGKLFMA